MITNSYNPDKQRLEVQYEGNVNVEEIINFIIHDVGEDHKLPRDLKILSDATRAKFNFTAGHIEKITETMQQIIPQFRCVCDAFIIDTALETGLTMIYGQSMKQVKNHYLEVFSTKSAAVTWLNMYA